MIAHMTGRVHRPQGKFLRGQHIVVLQFTVGLESIVLEHIVRGRCPYDLGAGSCRDCLPGGRVIRVSMGADYPANTLTGCIQDGIDM